MLVGLPEILERAESEKIAIPAFNVYNLETALGVAHAAEALDAPIIFQLYDRLFASGLARALAPSLLAIIESLPVPCAFHLDHGSTMKTVKEALDCGVSSVMIDGSSLDFAENVTLTRQIVALAQESGISVEGELGHIGTTGDEKLSALTDPDEAVAFVEATGVTALAIMIGTAHGRYRQAPVLDIPRLSTIVERTQIPIVLHGGSGVDEQQILAAIAHGVRKINFGTDLCYAFLDEVRSVPEEIFAVDLFMRKPTEAVKQFAMQKIRLLRGEV